MRCDKCKIELIGAENRCPLCQSDLIGEPNEEKAVFPRIPYMMRPNHRFLSSVAFVSVAIGIISIAVNLSFPETGWWSILVIAGIISLWLSLIVIIKKHGNIHKTIIYQVAVISIVSVFWDLFTGFHKWSINYVIPISCTSALVLMAVLARIMKLNIADYMIYIILDTIVGIVSLILLLCGILTVKFPSTICFAASFISLAAMVVFAGKTLRSEMQRRMHL